MPESEQQNAQPAELNARVFQALARFIREQRGERIFSDLCDYSRLERRFFDGRTHWISLRQAESFLEGARKLVDTDNEFAEACGYKLKDSLGALGFLLKATTPGSVLARTASTTDVVSRISRISVPAQGRGWVQLRYESDREESRLMCLSRQGFAMNLPSLWDLPPLAPEERACIAWGDDYCEHIYRFYQPVRGATAVAGAILAIALALGISLILQPHWTNWLLVPLGALVGYALELRQSYRSNLDTAADLNKALEAALRHEAETSHELMALHQREREWQRLLAEASQERARSYQRTWQRVQSEASAREALVRGVSHDLRSPLTVLRAIGEVLERQRKVLDPIDEDLVGDHQRAISRMERMISDLLDALTGKKTAAVDLNPETLDVTELTESIRRRLRALLARKPVHATVFKTRTAPPTIHADASVVDRILDNLLTNAVKYTERGSIVVEISGSDEGARILFTVSDTGRGIPEEVIHEIFEPEGSNPGNRAPDSYGVGLSIVTQLLGQVGGHLEVLSNPGKGTTFWVYLPSDFDEARPHDDPGEIVSIRPAPEDGE